MLRMLAYIQKNFVVFIPAAMVSGLLFGYFSDPSILRSLILPLIILMVFPMMMGVNFRSLLSGVDIKLQVTTQLFNFLIVPFVAFLLSLVLLPQQPYLSLGLLIMGILPTAGGTIAWTGFCKGNVTASVKMVVIGLILGGILAPVYINLLMGKTASVPFSLIAQKIVYVIFLPMIAAIGVRWPIIKKYGMKHFQEKIKPVFGEIATLGPLGFVFIGLSLRAQYIVENPQIILWLLLPLLLFYLINYALGVVIAKLFLDRENGAAFIYGTAMRHLSLSLAVSYTVFGEKGADIALIITVAFILQTQFAALFLKWSDKLLGAPAKKDDA